MGGDFGGVVATGASVVDLGGLAHVHEVVVEVLDFDGGFGLVDGGLGEGDEEAEDGAEDGEDEPGGFVEAEDAPIFEEAAGFGAVVIGIGREGGIGHAIAAAVTVGRAAGEGAGLIGRVGPDDGSVGAVGARGGSAGFIHWHVEERGTVEG